MANLKGNSYKKQIRDAYFRVYALGISRYENPESSKTHSLAVEKKRKMYLNDLVAHADSMQLTEKLNILLGTPNFINSFLIQRMVKMTKKSSLDYISGISSLFIGLRQSNIFIAINAFNEIENVREFTKEMQADEFRTGRYLKNPNQILNRLFEINFECGVIAQVQHETGFRISEAYELIRFTDKYLISNSIVGLVGKSKHKYAPKEISSDLIQKLSAVQRIPSGHLYSKNLKLATNNIKTKPHDWRVSFVKDQFEKEINKGKTNLEALIIESKLVNHHRSGMTEYYLVRA
jgi:hypothetical protein